MKIDVRTNFPEVQRALASAFDNQVPFALARALTRTAQDVREAQRKALASVFDRPTPYTLNSLYIRPATKQRLEALVWVKDQAGQATHPLTAQIEGGDRGLKRFEFRLVRAGLMRPNERAVPGAGAQLDRFGNMSRGQIVKILSQLKTAAVVGDFSDATNSRRSRAKRATEAYFVSRGRGTWVGGGAWKNGEKSQHLPRGVWVRRSFGALGTAVKPVLIFVDQTTYKQRFKFFEIARQVIDRRFASNFTESFNDAVRSTILRQGGRL